MQCWSSIPSYEKRLTTNSHLVQLNTHKTTTQFVGNPGSDFEQIQTSDCVKLIPTFPSAN